MPTPIKYLLMTKKPIHLLSLGFRIGCLGSRPDLAFCHDVNLEICSFLHKLIGLVNQVHAELSHKHRFEPSGID